jgi:hypothetical protein
MRRLAGVNAIAVICFLYAGYLGAGAVLSTIGLPSPMMPSAEYLPGLKRAVPYLAILVGLGWTLIGRGLLQTRSWARWAVILMAVWGIASGLAPTLYYSPLWGPFLLVGLQIIVRAVIVCYLLRASVARQFSQPAKAA